MKYILFGKYSWVIVALLITVNVQAQDTTAFRNLSIGDTLPDFTISKLFNSAKRSLNTADFKDQLLIIDFWSRGCSTCIAELPKMEALQKQFGNKITILPVNEENEEGIKTFWAKNKNTKNLSLPSVVEDKQFTVLFKHVGLPHEVWVYKGKVIGITEGDYVDEKNISRILNGETVNWPVKYDFYTFDGQKEPIFKLDADQVDVKSTPVQYAAISGYKEGVPYGTGMQIIRDSALTTANGKTIRVLILNRSIYSAYMSSWFHLVKSGSLVKPTEDGFAASNEIKWEVADKSRYEYEPLLDYRASWYGKHAICFESVYPDTGQTDQMVYKTVIEDLNRLLGLDVRWEKRGEVVWVIKRAKTPVQVKPAIPAGNRGISLSTLCYQLNQQASNPYAFDESGYGDHADIAIDLSPATLTDKITLSKKLAMYGLVLKEERRKVDKLVFTEINGGLLYQAKPEL